MAPVYESHQRFYLAIRLVPGEDKKSFTPHPSIARDRPAVEARDRLIEELLGKLRAAGQESFVPGIAKVVASAATDQELVETRLYVEQVLCTGLRQLKSEVLTVAKFAADWTSGRLAKLHRDHVKRKKSADDDERHFRLYINDLIGELPLHLVQLHHCKAVMEALPEDHAPATRRHVAQAMNRLFRLAVILEKIERSPIPPGWLPKVPRASFSYLYPDEVAALLGCVSIPVQRRVLYALLAYEGGRKNELARLRWSQLGRDLAVVRLEDHKTEEHVGERVWSLGLDVRALLGWWASQSPSGGKAGEVFPGVSTSNLARQLRKDLQRAGIEREELFETVGRRRRLRAHDLRATFVTLSLALGKTETWVMDRTGHVNSATLKLYRRGARTAAELELGWLRPAYLSIPECASAYRDLEMAGMRGVGAGSEGSQLTGKFSGEGGIRTLGTLAGTHDFQSHDSVFEPQKPAEFEPPANDSEQGIPAADPPTSPPGRRLRCLRLTSSSGPPPDPDSTTDSPPPPQGRALLVDCSAQGLSCVGRAAA